MLFVQDILYGLASLAPAIPPSVPRDTFCTGYLSWARNDCLYVKPIGRLKSTFHRAQRGGQYPIWNRTVEKILFLYCKWAIIKHSVERREFGGRAKRAHTRYPVQKKYSVERREFGGTFRFPQEGV